MRDNRIKSYRFPLGSLIASAGGIIDIYTPHTLNGTLQSIQLVAGNFTATGSFDLTVSGTGETIWSIISGTNTNNIAVSDTVFPRAIPRDTTNLSLSGANYFTEIVMNSDLRLIGSGLGNATSGLGLNIQYI